MATKGHHKPSDIERRLASANGPLAAELYRRGIASRHGPGSSHQPRLAGALLAAELANADRQLAARAVLRRLLSCDELKDLGTMLKFQPRGRCAGKLDALTRIVERAVERCEGGDHGSGH